MERSERNIVLGFAIAFILVWIGFKIRNSNLASNVIGEILPHGIVVPAQISVAPNSNSRGRRLMRYKFKYEGKEYEHSDPRLAPCSGGDFDIIMADSIVGYNIYILLDSLSLKDSWALLTREDYVLAELTPREGYYLNDDEVCY